MNPRHESFAECVRHSDVEGNNSRRRNSGKRAIHFGLIAPAECNVEPLFRDCFDGAWIFSQECLNRMMSRSRIGICLKFNDRSCYACVRVGDSSRQCVIEHSRHIAEMAEQPICLRRLLSDPGISRIELDGALEILGTFLPLAAATCDKGGERIESGFIRQTSRCHSKLGQSSVVIAKAMVCHICGSESRFEAVWAQPESGAQSFLGQRYARRSMISSGKVEISMRTCEQAISRKKVRIICYGLFQEPCRLAQMLGRACVKCECLIERFRA